MMAKLIVLIFICELILQVLFNLRETFGIRLSKGAFLSLQPGDFGEFSASMNLYAVSFTLKMD